MYEILAVLGGIGLIYGIFAGRIERSWISGPMVFILIGLGLGPHGIGLVTGTDLNLLKSLAELTLALVLFTDATGSNFAVLRRIQKMPTRMLAVGLPLTIGLGIVAGHLIFPDWPLLEVALLATILAPTDAALGKPVVTNPQVPASTREALNVESGLNDGICVPVLFLFLNLISGRSGHSPIEIGVDLFAEEVGIGLAVAGVVVGCSVGLLRLSKRWDGLSSAWITVLIPGMAFTCFGIAQSAGGSGFIAAFVGGLLFGILCKTQITELLKAAEGIGNTLAYLTWTLFGAVVVSDVFQQLDVQTVVYALLSLTLVRMLPIAISLAGLGQSLEQKLFLGWFGPRGLASIVFIVIVLSEHPNIEQLTAISLVVAFTVTLSVVLHGVTANPWANRM
ncbi:MAG: cation:proton antiporter [Planctomycetaceae bacterium]